MKKKITKKGKSLLRDPLLNKGTAFTWKEREMFEIEGYLPCGVSTMAEQLERREGNFKKMNASIEKYEFLTSLQNRNETLFYRFAQDHVEEILPYIYTPTVGEASLDFSTNYHSSRGIYIPYTMEDKIESILRSCEQQDVSVIVATDGGSVLGLGDVGIGGMVIPIGKCSLYTLFGAIDPAKTLPIFLDVGTDNPDLLNDKYYIGIREKRLPKERYLQFMDRFATAVRKVFPNALLQWEDMHRLVAVDVLDRFQSYLCSFNDDIQGTAGTALAGILSAMRIKGSHLKDEKIAIFGPGSAGMGIANIMVDYLERCGVPRKEAYAKVYLIDRRGLVYDGIDDIHEMHGPYCKSMVEVASWNKKHTTISLLDTIEGAKITTLIGTSAQYNAFSPAVLAAMSANAEKPIIFPLSNPNSKAEADPKEILKYTNGNAIIATGSPYVEFEYNNKKVDVPQCNNVNIFPAIGLAAAAFNLPKIPNEVFIIAGEALSQIEKKRLFPRLSELREKTAEIAVAIGQYCAKEKLIPQMSEREMQQKVAEVSWQPEYEEYEL